MVTSYQLTRSMEVTWGYYVLINYLQKLHLWTTPNGYRDFSIIIFFIANFALTCYPGFKDFGDVKMHLEAILFHLQFALIGIVSVYISLGFLINKERILKMMERLSKHNDCDMAHKLISIDKRMKNITTIGRYTGFISTFLIMCCTLSDKTCFDGSTSTITCNFPLQYYVPFKAEAWQVTLMALFQIYTFGILGNTCTGGLIATKYTFEIFLIRLEDLTYKISKMRFKKDQTNDVELHDNIKYYQHTIMLYRDISNIVSKWVLPLKFIVTSLIALSAVRIALKRDLAGTVLFILSMIMLLVLHTIGQRIINASSSVSVAIYNLNWYDANVATQKQILIFLCQSQQTLILKLNIFGSFCYSSMAEECKKMFAWFNFIIKMLSKR